MTTATAHINRPSAVRRVLVGALLATLVASVAAVETTAVTAAPAPTAKAEPAATPRPAKARTWKIHYRAWNGVRRTAWVILPASYGPKHNPPLPLVISPHGRGGNGRVNAGYWGNLPAVGGFAVVNPDGMGRRVASYSFAYSPQIDDLARMPQLVTRALPWLRIDHRRIYALGSSMGGLETLMLVARHPHLLAGAVAMDSVTDMFRRYEQMPEMPCNRRCMKVFGRPYGLVLRDKVVREVGSTPAQNPRAWAARSPLSHARSIASSGVPLSIWWSRKDRIVQDQAHQSGRLYATLRGMHPQAPLCQYVGRWAHSHEMRSYSLLAFALAGLDLLPDQHKPFPGAVRCVGGAGV